MSEVQTLVTSKPAAALMSTLAMTAALRWRTTSTAVCGLSNIGPQFHKDVHTQCYVHIHDRWRDMWPITGKVCAFLNTRIFFLSTSLLLGHFVTCLWFSLTQPINQLINHNSSLFPGLKHCYTYFVNPSNHAFMDIRAFSWIFMLVSIFYIVFFLLIPSLTRACWLRSLSWLD